MKLISPVLKHVVYPGLSRVGYRHPGSSGPVVLTYHGVFPEGYKPIDPDLDGSLVTAVALRRQLRILQDQYHVIAPEEFLLWCQTGHVLPPRSVLLTCDDGLRNSLTHMLPVLREFQLPCLFFVTGASLAPASTMLWYEELYLMFLATAEGFNFELSEVGLRTRVESRREKRVLWWVLVRKLSRYDASRREVLLEAVRMQLGLAERWQSAFYEDPVFSGRFLTMNRSELCELAAAGGYIGAHTLTHPMLSQSSTETAWNEIFECKLGLESALDRNIWALAYPFGDLASTTSREFQMAQRAGYQCAFVNVSGDIESKTSKFALPRMHVTANMTDSEFEAHVSGLQQFLRQFVRPAKMSAAAGSNS